MDDQHILNNFRLVTASNLARINNEYVVDFRLKLVQDNIEKISKNYEKL